MNSIKRITSDVIGLLFPELCAGCSLTLYYGERTICEHCLYDLPYTDFHINKNNPVAQQFWGRVPVEAAMAMLYFRKGTKVQSLIHHLKYKGQSEVGFKLGGLLGARLMLSEQYKAIDYIIPVPLHLKKERIRGYNQSIFIAEGIAQVLQIPVKTAYLFRNKLTESQTQKSRYIRYQNMESVFSVRQPEQINQKHILLVDDVLSTGATLEACGNSLLHSGIKKLSIATLAFS
ncbi:MAG: phosphoribosyltransferase family protein [Bacteroidota bacterium]